MATVQLNPIFEGFSRKIGNLVFYRRNGKPCVRRMGDYKGGESPAQEATRKAFKESAAIWTALTGVVQAAWNTVAQKTGITGYNVFLGKNIRCQRDNVPLVISVAMGEESVPGISCVSGGVGEVVCTLTVPAGAACNKVTLFVQPMEEGMARDAITRYDAGIVSNYTITGLASGRRYTCYAVLTDNAYPEATMVSASASCVAVVV